MRNGVHADHHSPHLACNGHIRGVDKRANGGATPPPWKLSRRPHMFPSSGLGLRPSTSIPEVGEPQACKPAPLVTGTLPTGLEIFVPTVQRQHSFVLMFQNLGPCFEETGPLLSPGETRTPQTPRQ